jgi:Pentapeptide repeats (8 copies)
VEFRHRSVRWLWLLVDILASLAVVAGLIWALWRLPPLLYGDVTKASPDARLQAASSFRTALVAGLAGLAALAGLFFTNRTYRLTQQGQLTDRYTRAIEQLGATDKLDVRLGGIYALERIAVDSKRDHPTVVEVLSAFIREHSDPGHTHSEPTVAQVLSTFLRGDEPAPQHQPDPGTEEKPKLARDLQAAVTVLGRLPSRPDTSRGDLSGAQLSGAWLYKANLSDAGLMGANLSGAVLSEANLSSAGLRGADLPRAVLRGANLSGARLVEANLSSAWLEEANLSDTVLSGADLSDARLNGADLSKTLELTQAQLDAARGDATTRLPDGLRRPASWTTG